MSALGMASLGALCRDKSLGQASLGVFCPSGEERVSPGAVWWDYQEQRSQEEEEFLLLCEAFLRIIS